MRTSNTPSQRSRTTVKCEGTQDSTSEVGTQLKLKQGPTRPMCGNWNDSSTRHESTNKKYYRNGQGNWRARAFVLVALMVIDHRVILRHVSYEILLIHDLHSERQPQARCVIRGRMKRKRAPPIEDFPSRPPVRRVELESESSNLDLVTLFFFLESVLLSGT